MTARVGVFVGVEWLVGGGVGLGAVPSLALRARWGRGVGERGVRVFWRGPSLTLRARLGRRAVAALRVDSRWRSVGSWGVSVSCWMSAAVARGRACAAMARWRASASWWMASRSRWVRSEWSQARRSGRVRLWSSARERRPCSAERKSRRRVGWLGAVPSLALRARWGRGEGGRGVRVLWRGPSLTLRAPWSKGGAAVLGGVACDGSPDSRRGLVREGDQAPLLAQWARCWVVAGRGGGVVLGGVVCDGSPDSRRGLVCVCDWMCCMAPAPPCGLIPPPCLPVWFAAEHGRAFYGGAGRGSSAGVGIGGE